MEDFIKISVVAVLVLGFILLVANLAGRTFVYADDEQARRVQVCVEQGVEYGKCYDSVHNFYEFNE